MKRFWLTFAVVMNLVLADAVVKELAAGLLKDSAAFCVIPGFLNLAYVENRGCAWGLFQGQVWPLAAFGLVALALLVWKRRAVFDFPAFPLSRARFFPSLFPLLLPLAEPFLYAGILGNVIDRIFRGYVIDMFDFHWGAHHYPCFNIADALICIAAGLMILNSFTAKKTSEEKR